MDYPLTREHVERFVSTLKDLGAPEAAVRAVLDAHLKVIGE